MGSRGRWVAAAMSIALGLSVLGVAAGTVAQAGEEPVFHLPFPCGEMWTASTRTGHSPSIDAVDFNRPADAGAHVLAGADGGTVLAKGEESGYGHYVKIAYPGNVELLFAHLQGPSPLGIDDAAGAQTVVGLVGASGLSDSSAHHLHYEQRVGGVPRPVVIEGESWQMGVDVADDRDDLAANPGIAHTSRNCAGSGSDTDEPVDGIPVAQWIEPAEGATVGPQFTLAAWLTPSLVGGSLVDATDIARIDFHVLLGDEDEAVPACSADQVDDLGRWSCQADLRKVGVAAGEAQLVFDVTRSDGDVVSSPDGVRTVVYAPSPQAEWRAPKKGAKLSSSSVVLSAKVADSSVATDIARVVFSVQWDKKKPKQACVASKPQKKEVWSCKVDLWKLEAPLGRLTLSFDLIDADSNVISPDEGVRGVRFAAPPPSPANVRVVTDIDAALDKCQALPCRFPYQLRWRDVDGELGYRIYVRYLWWTVGENCSINTGKTGLLGPTRLPANTSVFKGVFEGPEYVAGKGYTIYGSQYYVEAYNRAGQSSLVASQPQKYFLDANCNEIRAP